MLTHNGRVTKNKIRKNSIPKMARKTNRFNLKKVVFHYNFVVFVVNLAIKLLKKIYLKKCFSKIFNPLYIILSEKIFYNLALNYPTQDFRLKK